MHLVSLQNTRLICKFNCISMYDYKLKLKNTIYNNIKLVTFQGWIWQKIYVYTIITKHCREKFKTLSNWKDLSIVRSEHSILLRCQLPSFSLLIQHNTNENASRILFCNKLILFLWKWKESRIAETILIKKKHIWVLILPKFKIYYKAAIIKIAQYLYERETIDQWNGTESPDIDSRIYYQLIFTKLLRG